MVFDLMINNMPVRAKYSDQNVKEIFLPLLHKLDALQKQKNGRILVMAAAPPAAGKSTLTKALACMADGIPGMEKITVVGMDGYHKYQSYLDTHTLFREGEEILMAKVKGCPETFDIEKLEGKIREVTAGKTGTWPDFDRIKEDPVEDALIVDSDIVLLEGNYLLLNEKGWRDLSKYADYTISVSADQEFLRSRLIDRRVRAGVPRKDAEEFVDFSDMYNVRMCLRNTMPADLMLYLESSGEYSILHESGL